MEAFRAKTTVTQQRLILDVPAAFDNQEVEVIIFAVTPERPRVALDRATFWEFLRNGPTLSEEELKQIDEVKKEFRNWTSDVF